MTGPVRDMGAWSIHRGHPLPQQHMGIQRPEVHDNVLGMVSSAIPPFEGHFDPHAYINWELKVDKEFEEYDLFEKQMVFAKSNALTKDALYEWKHLCRHDIVLQT